MKGSMRRLSFAVALALGLTLGLLGLFGRAPVVRAATFNVTQFADTNDGVCDAHCSLREAIIAANAAPGSTIILPAGTYLLSITGTGENDAATGDLDVNAPLQIVGAGSGTTIVDGGGIDRVFHVHGTNVSFSGLTIRNGNVAGSGGGINVVNGLQLTDVIVVDNVAGFYGGGIFVNSGDLTLQDTQVLSNTAQLGGGIYFNSDTNSLLTLRGDSVIAYNQATGTGLNGIGGGVHVSQGGRVALEAGRIVSNTAEWDGGGLFLNTSNATLGGIEISGNTANTCGGGVYIRYGNVTMSGTQVISNTAGDGGGGVYAETTGAFLTLNGGSVIADNRTDMGGGGLFIRLGRVVLFDGQVIRNSAGTSGGGIFVHMEDAFLTQAEGSLIAHNHAAGTDLGQGGGGLYVNTGSALLQGGQILSNDAVDGGGVYVNGPTAVLTQTEPSVIAHNTATTGGGGVYVRYGSATLSGGEILSNTVTGAGSGGGVYIHHNRATSSGGQIRGNQANVGGGVYVRNNTAVFTQTGTSRITHNIASSNGGGVYVYQGRATLGGGLVCDNRTGGSGGGVYNYQGQVTSGGALICDNQARFSGGGIHQHSGILTLVNTTVSGNQAIESSSQGGGLYLSGGTAALTYTTFAYNTAGSGGRGIHRGGSSTVLLQDTILAYNGAANCNLGLTSNGYNLDSGATCGLGQASDQQNTNPLLGPLADNGGDTLTHELLEGSPAIDSGFCVAGIHTDQRGIARPGGVGCDIGAYEVEGFRVYLPLVIRN